ncbi:hypothetical protein GCM10011390_39970 [Aureimonas endophytica]|uniref:Uncharacterized protein n=1 Tax=Aureimonas endophytica TaxID=2027858 RepID=A0A917EBB7_9HYPH|nr:hypothetical protein GCM10011390_39970 [Aureimonas endophytica]
MDPQGLLVRVVPLDDLEASPCQTEGHAPGTAEEIDCPHWFAVTLLLVTVAYRVVRSFRVKESGERSVTDDPVAPVDAQAPGHLRRQLRGAAPLRLLRLRLRPVRAGKRGRP